jgi:hypothetical protein
MISGHSAMSFESSIATHAPSQDQRDDAQLLVPAAKTANAASKVGKLISIMTLLLNGINLLYFAW